MKWLNDIKQKFDSIIDWGMAQYDRLQSVAFKFSFVRINRKKFLTHVLKGRLSEEQLKAAIEGKPSDVVSREELQRIGKKQIVLHAVITSVITFFCTMPDNLVLFVVCFIFDVVQAQLNIYMIAQKLMYLHDCKDMNEGNRILHEDITNILWTISVIMIGRNSIRNMAKTAGSKITRTLISELSLRVSVRVSLANIIRQGLKWTGIKMTHEMLQIGINLLVNLLCCFVAGAVSYWIFYPIANNLNKKLAAKGYDAIKQEMTEIETDQHT